MGKSEANSGGGFNTMSVEYRGKVLTGRHQVDRGEPIEDVLTYEVPDVVLEAAAAGPGGGVPTCMNFSYCFTCPA